MSLKAGDLLTVGNTILIDRIQTGGPGQLNIPTEKIYELGNYQSVATVRDTPDLSFTNESWDVSPEFEAMLVGGNYATDAAGTRYALANSLPIDVVNEFKRGKTDTLLYNVAGSVVIPYLALESMSYRYGIRDNAAQTATLRGDSIFYAAASGYIQEATGTASAGQVVTFTNAPIQYNGDVVAGTRYALSVCLASGTRLILGTDYTETSTAVTVLAAVPVTDKIRIAYQSNTVASYPQTVHAADSATRPSSIKGKYIEVYVGGYFIGDKWPSVQAVTLEYRVTLDKDEEFGNSNVIAQDYDVPAVTGSIDVKPRTVAELLTRVRQIGNVTAGESVGPFTAVPLSLVIKLKSPTTGATLKTLEVPDARFTLPGYSGQIQQKLTVSLPFESDGGILYVYKGDKPDIVTAVPLSGSGTLGVTGIAGP